MVLSFTCVIMWFRERFTKKQKKKKIPRERFREREREERERATTTPSKVYLLEAVKTGASEKGPSKMQIPRLERLPHAIFCYRTFSILIPHVDIWWDYSLQTVGTFAMILTIDLTVGSSFDLNHLDTAICFQPLSFLLAVWLLLHHEFNWIGF